VRGIVVLKSSKNLVDNIPLVCMIGLNKRRDVFDKILDMKLAATNGRHMLVLVRSWQPNF